MHTDSSPILRVGQKFKYVTKKRQYGPFEVMNINYGPKRYHYIVEHLGENGRGQPSIIPVLLLDSYPNRIEILE